MHRTKAYYILPLSWNKVHESGSVLFILKTYLFFLSIWYQMLKDYITPLQKKRLQDHCLALYFNFQSTVLSFNHYGTKCRWIILLPCRNKLQDCSIFTQVLCDWLTRDHCSYSLLDHFSQWGIFHVIPRIQSLTKCQGVRGRLIPRSEGQADILNT